MVDDLFKYLDIDKSEWVEDIKHGDSSSASFMACVVSSMDCLPWLRNIL